MKYDVVIAYRIYPKFSHDAYELKGWDKYKLCEVCLKSFLRCLSGVNFKLYAILDGCPPEYNALFRDLIVGDRLEIIHFPGIGNAATFLELIKVLLAQNDSDIVYFAEDDYFYLENKFQDMLEAIKRKDVDFVCPFDSTNLHGYKSKIIFEKRHWRTVASTSCTFLTTKSTLMKTSHYFKLYTNLIDYGMWLVLTKLRIYQFMYWLIISGNYSMLLEMYILALRQLVIGKSFKLWSPIPSIATHMVKQYFAPGIDWQVLINQYSLNK